MADEICTSTRGTFPPRPPSHPHSEERERTSKRLLPSLNSGAAGFDHLIHSVVSQEEKGLRYCAW